MATFDEVFGNCTPQEREALVWHLASIRYQNTIRALLPRGEIVNPHVFAHAPQPSKFPESLDE